MAPNDILRLVGRFSSIAVLLALTACNPFYVMRAGYEHARILRAREPISELLGNESIPEETRRQLGLVLEAQAYAGPVLGLNTGGSYTTYVELESDVLAFVLSAAPMDRLELRTWWFPIVGRMPYKGFFSEAAAQRRADRLGARGFDTEVRTVAAFSTLGWFSDPLYSTLLALDDVSLVNTVIHELVHNTIYLSGQCAFNESIATFVGARGAIDFFCERDPHGANCREAKLAWEDDLLFGAFLTKVIAEIETMYGSDLSRKEILEKRDLVFDDARVEFREHVQPRLLANTFRNFDTSPMNNATLMSRKIYYHRLDYFEEAYLRHGADLPALLRRIVEEAEAASNPWDALEVLKQKS